MGRRRRRDFSRWNLVLVVVVVVILSNARASTAQLRYACDVSSNASLGSFPFCDTKLGIDVRVQDLVSRLTLDEKVDEMVNAAQGIPRLGVPSYQWWQEALHGVASSPGVQFGGLAPAATSFPMPIATAASFNSTLFYSIGEAVSSEARALHNLGRAGLTFWSPNVNIFRDPRWGRGQETPGEDPLLASKFASLYVRGLQGGAYEGSASDGFLKVSACCKHLTAYDVDNWKGMDRYHFNAEVSEQDLVDTYNPPFQSCIEDGRVSSVMCSYNRVNGVPTCADRNLLTETVRNSWGFNGYIVSDCDALQVLFEDTTYAPSAEDAVADSILAGLDLNCGTFLGKHAKSALQAGKITEADLDHAVSNLMRTRMRLGLFDGDPNSQPYSSLGATDICSNDHQQLALDAALQGVVLLKNDGSLPLSTALKTVALIGPNANATYTMLGNYEGIPCKYISPLQGMQIYSSNILYSPGCRNVACNEGDLVASAVEVATKADAVVLVVGLDQSQERETFDRTSLLLPGMQSQLVSNIANAVTSPIVLVIMSAGPVDISTFKDNSRISSVIWLGYPGQSGGAALAHVVFGAYNPGGRLPNTWYHEEFTNVSMLDMQMRPNPLSGYPGRSYRFYTGTPLYNFGDGLSYSTYFYKFLLAPTKLSFFKSNTGNSRGCPAVNRSKAKSGCFHLPADDLETCNSILFQVSVEVSNLGPRSGSHSVLIFSAPPPVEGAPLKQLIAFQKVHLESDTTQRLIFGIDPCKHLSSVRRNGKRFLHSGRHKLLIGNAVHILDISKV
ncbi:hypothetical protein SELMODRAFT_101733 [Selaginella moellendorffii]|uniref:Fibronectin type III-like domain-containing protein n=1 Tax=Selaginella moellendorffii TaxID=88036 RepID=D8RU61_SELML|nr:probable beta-D-xylosidase 5 isoform X1 [Selaginella moellendorffii]EFJ24353.1 hypothetical protein SELMODRAFT_101733 [Selaginella moellendorffii]|eukprot:XP_002974833.1 probable beta-D-xylosidase 5 isoform X1 [Selaginella moellendorffii]